MYKNTTGKSLVMKNASQIEIAAKNYIEENPELMQKIQALKNDHCNLFKFFIASVKDNTFLVVSYILNNCFTSADERANFGNIHDEMGNTAFHYAAIFDFEMIIIILNDKRAYLGKRQFFKFNAINNEGLTPLDLCCKHGHQKTFNLLWPRVGKANHNPTHSFQFACVGGNETIIETIYLHPKFDIFNSTNSSIIANALQGMFGNGVKSLIIRLTDKKNTKQNNKHKTVLKRHAFTEKDMPTELSRKKANIELKL